MMESFRVLAKYQNGLTPKSERFDTAKQRHRILFCAKQNAGKFNYPLQNAVFRELLQGL